MTQIPVLAVLLALGMLLAGCNQSESVIDAQPSAENSTSASSKNSKETTETKESAEAPKGAPIRLTNEEIKAAGIRTEMVEEGTVHERVPLTATIQANQDRLAHVTPRVPGRIVSIGAKLGDRVRAGQALANLDSIELGEAHSAYLQADSQLRLAQTDFERAEKLYGEQIVSQKDYIRSRAEYEKARANLRMAADKLRLMGVTPAKAEAAISVFPLTVPFAGTVIEKKAVLGELASPDKAIFTIADLSTVWIEADLFEKDLNKVRVGAAAGVTVAAYPNEVFKGRLTYISSVMNKESRTVKARIEIPNADGRLKPDMFATATVEMAAAGRAMTISANAVLLAKGKKIVFVREMDGFELRAVELGDNLGGRYVVKDGLEEGDEVVTAGGYALKARLLKSKIGDHD